MLLRATLYVASMLGIGYALKSTRLLGNEEALSKYVMYVAMPSLALSSLSNLTLNLGLLRTLATYLLSMIMSSLLIYLLGRASGLERSRVYLLILAANFSNTGFFGIPFISTVFKDPGALQLSIVLWMATFIFSSLLCIPLLESLKGGSEGKLRRVLIRTLGNPLTVSVLAGVLLGSIGQIPSDLMYVLESLGVTASPLALISIGASLSTSRSTSISTQGILLALRIFLAPLLSLVLGLVAGLGSMELSVLVLMSAMPAAVFLGVFSSEYDFHREEVHQLITISSLTAPLYLSIWFYLLRSLSG